jgi:hypothetical protein
MGKKSAPPPAPDYTGAAEKSAQSSQEAQTRADWANRPTQNTPWGQSSWTSTAAVDPATGKPVTNWTQNISLSGDQQKALDDQMAMQSGRSDLAMNMMGRVGQATSQPFDWGSMQQPGQGGGQVGGLNPWYTGGAGMGMQNEVGGTGLESRQRLEDAMMERMRPQHEQQQAGLEGKLQNMGLTRGSEAWNREMQRMGDQQSRERFNALDRGLQEQQGQFGMNLQQGQFGNQAQNQAWQQMLSQNQQNFGQDQAAGQQNFGQNMQQSEYMNKLRQQQIAEQMMQRNMPLNEMNALLTGQQVGMPSMPGFQSSTTAGGANYLQAANMGYNSAMDQYNAKQAQSQGMMSGLGSLAGMGMMAFSDIRLKDNIERVGTHPVGVGIYDYDIFGRRERGVMAQELMQVRPDLVAVHDSGYLMVNYGGLQ